MARARNIKPGFFRNADLVELPMEARLLFIGLWTLADRAGRMEDRPKQIKMEIFPAESVDCNSLLDQLAATKMVARYEVDGKRFLQVVNFAKHQNPHRDEKVSMLPDMGGHIADTEDTPKKHGANTVQPRCKEDVTSVAIGLTPDSGFLTADSLIPEKGEKPKATRASRLPQDFQPDLDFAKQEGITDPDREAMQFADYWAAQPGVKGTKADWSATWRTWCRNSHGKHISPAASKPRSPSANESFAERDARIGRERWEEMTGRTHPDSIKTMPIAMPIATQFVEDITPQFLENAR